MRTITTTDYLFDELSDDAKRKAVEQMRDINVHDSDWHEHVLEQAKTDLETACFADADIRYRGFWSQGDGASFTARVDLGTWLECHKLAGKYRVLGDDADSAWVTITQSGYYCHENTMDIDARFHGESDRADAQLQELQERILADARDRARAIYRALEQEYEYQTGDEQVIEAIRANSFEFTEDGKIAE